MEPEQDTRHGAGTERLIRSLFLIVPVAALATVVSTLATTGRNAWASLRPLDLRTALLALSLTLVPWFTDAARMAVWSRFLGAPLPYGPLLRLSAFAELGAAVTPPAVGTAPIKIAVLMRYGLSGGAAMTVTTLSSLEDWLFFLITVPLCLAAAPVSILPDLGRVFASAGPGFPWVLGGTVVVCVLASVWLRRDRASRPAKADGASGRLFERLRRVVRDVAASYRLIARRGKTLVLLALVLTAVQWVCRYSVVTVLVWGIGLPVHPVQFFALQAVIFALSSVVPTPGGAGGMEMLFTALHQSLIPGPMIGIATAAWRVSTFYIPVLVASVVALTWLPIGRRDRRPVSSEAGPSLPQPEI